MEDILIKREGRNLTKFEKFIKNEWLNYHKSNRNIIPQLRHHIFGSIYIIEYIITPELVDKLITNPKGRLYLIENCIHESNWYAVRKGITDDSRDNLRSILNKWNDMNVK